VAKEAGIEVDNTFDIRRVSTLIGTFNQKIKDKPLKTRWIRDFYYPNNLDETIENVRTAREVNHRLLDAILKEPIEATPQKPVEIQTDADFTPETLEKLNRLRQKDKKLDKLLNKEICIEDEPTTLKEPCEYKYKSRSETEFALVIKLIFYDFTKTQVFFIMSNISQIGKWREKDESYWNLTYNKALQFVEEYKAELQAEIEAQNKTPHEITNADFMLENGTLYDKLETPTIKVLIGNKKIKFVHEGKEIEVKLFSDPSTIEKELEKTNAKKEEIAYFKRIFEEGIQRQFILTKTEDDTLPKFASKIADVFLENFKIKTLAETDEILFYTNGVYKAGAESIIAKQIENIVPTETITKNLVEEVLGHIRRSTYEPRDRFNSTPDVINLKNGLLNLRTFELKPHTPDFLSTIQIPVEYNPNAKSELWEKVVHEDLYEEDTLVLQEAFGYSLYPSNIAQKMFVFLGQGNNGKSLILHVLEELIDKEHVANISPQELESNRFASSYLFGKLVNIYPDLPNFALQSSGKLKALVSGDSLTVEEKFKKPFSFRNHAKFYFSANILPKVSDNTLAFYRRLIIINFPKTFDESSADTTLAEKLTRPEELSGILNWALEGLQRLIQNNFRFSYKKSVEEIQEIYTRSSDPVKAFLDEETIEDSEAYIIKQDLYEAYKEYVKKHKLMSPLTPTTFFRNLLKYRKLKTEHKNVKGERKWVYTGIRLKTDEEKKETKEEVLLSFTEHEE